MVEQAFQQEVKEQFNPNQTAVIALSGGVDSMVLLELMRNLPDTIRPKLVLAHINHKLRPNSDMEEEAIRVFARENMLTLFVKKWTGHPETAVEEAGRIFRYDFFHEIVERIEADYLLTGHHMNDQAETILMRLVRGGRFNRMKGIERTRSFGQATLYRPLLTFKKAQLYDYAAERNVLYFEDETNAELDFTRNRYRNDILPRLKKENPHAENHLAEFAESVQEIDSIISEVVYGHLEKSVTDHKLSRQYVLESCGPSGKYVLQAFIYKEINKPTEIGPSHIKTAMEWLVEGLPNSSFQLPNQYELVRRYDEIALKINSKQNSDEFFEKELSLNSWNQLTSNDCLGIFTVGALKELLEANELLETDDIIYIPKDSVELPLRVRNRKNGDKMSLKGSNQGTKKIKDIFIDQKVPKEMREKAYIVEDDAGEIIWLVGFKESALSITFETDTIKYILIYRKLRQ